MTRYTNHYELPDEIVKAIMNDDYDHPTDENTIPCSKLISPARINILSKRHSKEIISDISDSIWALLGTSIHYILAKQGDGIAQIEQRISIPYKGYFITGKPDSYNPQTEEIKDFKVTSVWKYVYGPREGYREWTEQLNVYAWLLRLRGSKVAKLTITAILRDWSQREAWNNPSYPNIQIQQIDLPLWTEEEQEKFVDLRLRTIIDNNERDDNCLDVCSEAERWATATTWAVMKEGRKSAVRVFPTEQEAKDFIGKDDKHFSVVERKGEDKRCANYCSVNKFCNYFKEKNVS